MPNRKIGTTLKFQHYDDRFSSIGVSVIFCRRQIPGRTMAHPILLNYGDCWRGRSTSIASGASFVAVPLGYNQSIRLEENDPEDMAMNNKQLPSILLGMIAKKLCQMLAAGVLAALCILPAQAAVNTGDQFTSTFTETTGSDPGSTGTATITVGTPASPGFFNISSFSVIVNPDLCFSCGLLTEDLSGALFDATTLDLKGHITGTFNGSGGNLHRFDLALTDPAATWTFTNVRQFDGRTEISSGTYTPAVSSIPEPAAWIMLSLGLLAIAYRKMIVMRWQ